MLLHDKGNGRGLADWNGKFIISSVIPFGWNVFSTKPWNFPPPPWQITKRELLFEKMSRFSADMELFRILIEGVNFTFDISIFYDSVIFTKALKFNCFCVCTRTLQAAVRHRAQKHTCVACIKIREICEIWYNFFCKKIKK